MNRVFIDSDVLLDASLLRIPFAGSALNILELCRLSRLKGITSSIAFISTHYFLNKFASENKLEALKRIRSVVSIIEVDEKIIDLSLNSSYSDFEDGVQYYAAKRAGADVIITRNIKDYKQSDIQVLTPEQFLKTL